MTKEGPLQQTRHNNKKISPQQTHDRKGSAASANTTAIPIHASDTSAFNTSVVKGYLSKDWSLCRRLIKEKGKKQAWRTKPDDGGRNKTTVKGMPGTKAVRRDSRGGGTRLHYTVAEVVSLLQYSSQQHDPYNSTWRGYCVSLHNS